MFPPLVIISGGSGRKKEKRKKLPLFDWALKNESWETFLPLILIFSWRRNRIQPPDIMWRSNVSLNNGSILETHLRVICASHAGLLYLLTLSFFFLFFKGDWWVEGAGARGAAAVVLLKKKKKKSWLFQHEASESTSQTVMESHWSPGRKRQVAKWRIHFESVEAQRLGYLRT